MKKMGRVSSMIAISGLLILLAIVFLGDMMLGITWLFLIAGVIMVSASLMVHRFLGI